MQLHPKPMRTRMGSIAMQAAAIVIGEAERDRGAELLHLGSSSARVQGRGFRSWIPAKPPISAANARTARWRAAASDREALFNATDST